MICSLLVSKSQVRFTYVYGPAVVVRPFKFSKKYISEVRLVNSDQTDFMYIEDLT